MADFLFFVIPGRSPKAGEPEIQKRALCIFLDSWSCASRSPEMT